MDDLFDNKSNLTNLINKNFDKKIEEYIEQNKVTTLFEKIKKILIFLYFKFIHDNILLVIIILLITLFLFYRFCRKKYKDKFVNIDLHNKHLFAKNITRNKKYKNKNDKTKNYFVNLYNEYKNFKNNIVNKKTNKMLNEQYYNKNVMEFYNNPHNSGRIYY